MHRAQATLITLAFIILLLVTTVTVSFAADFRLGFSPALYSLAVEAPEGTSRASTGLNYLSGAALYPLGRDRRLLFGGSYLDFDVEPGTTEIGQAVSLLSAQGNLQFQQHWTRGAKPWLGIGAAYVTGEYEKRHTVDDEGFLAEDFDDRSASDFLLVFSAAQEWTWSEKLDLGACAEYFIPLDNGVEGLRIGLVFYPSF